VKVKLNSQDIHKTCPYCGNTGADSKDHVLPKQLLPKPLPAHPKPIIVHAHQTCNEGFREDDEYFCSFVLTERDVHPAASEPLLRFIKGVWKHENKKFRQKIQSEAIPTGLYGPDGEEIYWQTKEVNRIDRVLRRIVQGVARFQFDIAYIDADRISITKDDVNWSLFDEEHEVFERVAYTDAFRFVCQVHSADGQGSTWLLVFYENLLFQLFVE
jgi:hypothetical protein